MYFGQTSNWRRILEHVTDRGIHNYPQLAAEYADSINAVRVHCGKEAQVQLHCQLWLTTPEDIEAFDQFLKRFALPTNGYTMVDTHQPHPYSASAVVTGIVEHPLIAPPSPYNGSR